MTLEILKQIMFKYIENKDKTFLFGAYRGEKSQLDWILGEKTPDFINASPKLRFAVR